MSILLRQHITVWFNSLLHNTAHIQRVGRAQTLNVPNLSTLDLCDLDGRPCQGIYEIKKLFEKCTFKIFYMQARLFYYLFGMHYARREQINKMTFNDHAF